MPALFGTYWNEPDEEEGSTTPHAIVGGKMRIKTDNGITTIKAEFIDEDDSTLRVSYRGALEFENRINDSYRGDSKLNADYAMNADAPVVSIKKITDECTARYDRWDLHFYEKECYATQGATGYYLWFRLKTAPGQEYIPSGTYKATSDDTPGFLPGTRGRSRRRKSPGREHVVLQRPHAPCPDDQRFADPENVERNGLRSVVLDGRRPPDALSGDGIVLRNGEKARLQLGAPDRRIFAAVPPPGLPGRSGPESGRCQGRNFREVPALRFHAGRTVVGTAAAFGSGTVFRAAAALRTAPLSGQHCSRVSPVPGSADRSPATDRSPCGPRWLRLQHGPGGHGISGRIFRRTPGRRRCIPPCCPGRSRRVRLRERATAPFRPAWLHRADRPST